MSMMRLILRTFPSMVHCPIKQCTQPNMRFGYFYFLQCILNAMKRWKRISFWVLAKYIAIAEGAGALGTIFMGGIDPWYRSLQKPFFTPPDALFGPIWIVLYACMGTAAYLIWQAKGSKHPALTFYWIQLALNALWTPVFFGAHSLSWSLLMLLALVVLAVEACRRFAQVRIDAALIFFPYVAWVVFAAVLNFSLWYLN